VCQQTVATSGGRVIGFEMGIYHSMTALTSGRRCVLLVSFTVDQLQQELAHVQAETLLRGFDATRLDKGLKAEYTTSWQTHCTALEHRLPCGITQCYLPPNTGECFPP